MDLSRLLTRAAARIRALVQGGALDRELDEELRFHLDHLIAANVARGLAPDEAKREALLAMGGLEQRKEECRDTRGVRLVQDVVQDVRYALRTLRRAPAFATASILTLTLGIGVTVAMFSLVNGVLLRPLPFPDPDRLFLVALSPKQFFMRQPGMADATFVAFRERDRTFQHLAAFTQYKGNLVGAGDPVVIKVGKVTTEFFDAIRVAPAMGRTFLAGDGRDGREPTIVLSDRLWRSRLGSDPAIVGKHITVNGTAHSVIGVMPRGFDFPGEMAAWTPYVIKITPGNSLLMPVLGRLKPDVTVEQANAAFDATVAALPGNDIRDPASWTIGLVPLKELIVGDVRRPLQLFAGAVVVVLLIAAANVANLLLARAASREREISVRAALGAGKTRLVRQLLTESLLLSAVGTVLGLLVARWTIPALVAIAPAGRIPRAESVSVDAAAVIFAVTVAALTGIAFGLAPALRLSRAASPTLAPRGDSSLPRHHRLRDAVVVGQIALAMVLLTGAGLMMRSFLRLQAVDTGFRTENVAQLSIELPTSTYPTAREMQQFHGQMLAGLGALPDVAAAGMVNWLPLGQMHLNGDFRVEDASSTPSFSVDKTTTSPGYFRAMGIRLLRGREFTESDTATSARVAIVSRTVARAIDGSEDVLGKRVSIWGNDKARTWMTIVGVVDDVRQLGPAQKLHAAVYQPYTQVDRPFFLGTMTYVVLTRSDPTVALPAIREVLRSVDPYQPAASLGAMIDVVRASTGETAFLTRVLTVFAALALALAVVGTYGVIAYSVAQRTHEIGVRVALGARAGRVVRMVLRHTVLLCATGAALGAAAAWSVTRFMRAFLFETTPTDPATFAIGTLVIVAAAALAGLIPARRAARVDPLIALRHE